MRNLIALLLISITLTSCSTDESTNQNNNDAILGRWGTFKLIDDINNEIEYFVPYDGITTFNPDGTLTQIFLGTSTEGTWENLSNGTYRFSLFGFTAESEVQFISNTELTIYNDEDEYTEHYRRIESDSELINKVIGTWQLIEDCDDLSTTESDTITFNSDGTGFIDDGINGDITWEITNGSMYMTLLSFPNSDPLIVNIVFDTENKMILEFDIIEYDIQCLVRTE
ncbi:lipocalin-like domain-containing protein [uncultured Winogradskyella sp.]|uniref:lipocalin-like domain-containing protein n=1 Tax=uncultured Winogradskyella sp. TaxID=395353 RepID=UPI00261114C2|nr:glycoside hydrolase family 43 C-terminal domain-containing protein [uncultured Winogradskyella sp.]